MSDLVSRAIRFAQQAHESIGQRRKYSGLPYAEHLHAVAALVATVPHTPEMIAAAWLHDVVEDTPVSLADIDREFGAVVAGLVADLTDVSMPADGNRQIRKARDRAHSAAASAQAKTIKLADIIDNAASIGTSDPGFAKVFINECRMLLAVLQDGEPVLYAMAQSLIDDYYGGRLRPGRCAGNGGIANVPLPTNDHADETQQP